VDKSDAFLLSIIVVSVIIGIFSRSAWQSMLWAFVLVLVAFIANNYLHSAPEFPMLKVPDDLAPVVVLLTMLELGAKAIGVAVLSLLGYGMKRLFVRLRHATQAS
jgi:hypothetical protein